MAKVICTLPNASELINGVAFAHTVDGMVSEEISDDIAATFASINGYALFGVVPTADAAAVAAAQAAAAAAEAAQAASDQKIALLQRASDVGLKVKVVWGIDRLTTEVEMAEKAAAAAAASAPAPDAAPADAAAPAAAPAPAA